MKKKFLTFVLCVCFIVSGAILSACNTAKTTLTDQEWQSAFNLDLVEKYQISLAVNDVDTSACVKDGDIFYNHDMEEDGEHEIYVSIEDGEYFRYSKSVDSNVWYKNSITETEYGYYDLSSNVTFLATLFNQFEYDDALDAYKAENVQAESVVYSSVNIYFKDKHVSKVVMFANDMVGEFTITYNNTSLTLPQV